MAKTSLPPGFRFHPTDVELISYYLKRKIMGKPFRVEAISEIELYKFPPWDLPDKSLLLSNDREWYFFCARDKKYANGSRTNRATENGFWKTTGKDRSIVHNSRTVGKKKTLIFHTGKAPRGDRTNWVMYEYRMEDEEVAAAGFQQSSYVLCKIFEKSGMGPKIGEQYGALFREEDWDNDEDTIDPAFTLPIIPSNAPESLNNTTAVPVGQQSVVSAGGEASSAANIPGDDDLLYDDGISLEDLLANCLDDPPPDEGNELPDSTTLNNNNEAVGADAEGIYDELEDLLVWMEEREMGSLYNPGNVANCGYGMQPMLSDFGSEHYVELNDLCFLEQNDLPNDLLATHPLQSRMYYPVPDAGAVFPTASIANTSSPLRPTLPGDEPDF
ncbi:NAC domain-containing protein 78-like [Ananas comosus]|uniref:NAC domain-containing protein 78-like n=1 Tax=Ananas comosus TaxID=4615 RepID=A0A6P5EY66_ANACO|nr:NAC domain-containing protein 78-like [Ananas comosus]XP_020088504.1 NAC domain-containing protein 78-like [Ananas comosus]XP_020088505.1 NAC domain-containing protein 78-like [Ananas comosus]